jgi:hypothetical protein
MAEPCIRILGCTGRRTIVSYHDGNYATVGISHEPQITQEIASAALLKFQIEKITERILNVGDGTVFW